MFQDHLRFGNQADDTSRGLVELPIGLPQDMFHLRNGAKQRLAAGAHRAVVKGPSGFCIMAAFGTQAIGSDQARAKAMSGDGSAESIGGCNRATWVPPTYPARQREIVNSL
jgi:hypothetical protein